MSTSTRPRSRKAAYHHGDLRASLIAAATELLDREGISGVSLREAARRAGVSHAAPYRHFADRDALLAAVAARGFARLGEVMREAGPRGSLALGEAYVRFALERPNLYRLMFGGVLRIAGHDELREHALRTYEGLVRAFSAAGGGRREDMAAAAWSLVHGLAGLLLADHFPRATRAGRDTGAFVRAVLSQIRFAVGPAQSSA
jgi:AcrR family transcriptional regulator